MTAPSSFYLLKLFSVSILCRLLTQHGFRDVRDVTTVTVVKVLSDVKSREFTVFLMIGWK
jgi:hypothetical protein